MSRRTLNRGVALITAMLITALATIVAANLAWDNALDIRRTTVLLAYEQAAQLAPGAESWVSTILRQDLEDSDTDHLQEIWAMEFPVLPFEGGELSGSVADLQGRFNVNNLLDAQGKVDQNAYKQFQRLLLSLGLDPEFAGLTVDWLDADLEPSFPKGAEDSIYTALVPAYRTANQTISNVSELAALQGITAEQLAILLPNVAALPGKTTINVNTATPAVLQSLGENISVADVERLLVDRENGGFVDLATSFSTLVEPEILNALDTKTSYFQLKVVIRIGTVRFTLYSLLQRGPLGNVTPILRSFGTI
jgi:general secretion pathway protein K